MNVSHHPPVPGVLSEQDAECAVKCILDGCEAKPVMQATHKIKGTATPLRPHDVVKALRDKGVSWWNALRALPTILVLLVPGTAKLAEVLATVIELIESWANPPAPTAA